MTDTTVSDGGWTEDTLTVGAVSGSDCGVRTPGDATDGAAGDSSTLQHSLARKAFVGVSSTGVSAQHLRARTVPSISHRYAVCANASDGRKTASASVMSRIRRMNDRVFTMDHADDDRNRRLARHASTARGGARARALCHGVGDEAR
ncbi:MAG: hypothetical protein R3B06_19040 [Kofleriaceae bacterium]